MPSRHTRQHLHGVEGQQRDDSDYARPEIDELQTKSLLTEMRIANAAASRLLPPTAVARACSAVPQARRRILKRRRAQRDCTPQMHLDTHGNIHCHAEPHAPIHPHETYTDNPETYTDTNRKVRHTHALEKLGIHSLQVNLLASTEASTTELHTRPQSQSAVSISSHTTRADAVPQRASR
jgi:hypothetical protein